MEIEESSIPSVNMKHFKGSIQRISKSTPISEILELRKWEKGNDVGLNHN